MISWRGTAVTFRNIGAHAVRGAHELMAIGGPRKSIPSSNRVPNGVRKLLRQSIHF